MLKVGDLRIGNAFLQQGSNFVEFATVGDLVRIHEGSIIAEPIPLTEEWLLKLGFSHPEQSQKLFINGFFRIVLSVHNEWLFPDWEEKYIEIKYVHQLQNLYYSLTNQELTCN